MVRKATHLSVALLCACQVLMAQQRLSFWEPADTLQPTRKNWVVYGGGGTATAALTGLYFLWYAGYPQSGFHLINDNDNWLQMDKVGHSMSAYYVGELGYEGMRWAGFSERKSLWYGGLTGLGFLTVVEVMDGFSDAWGFSVGDMVANAAGSALFMGQQATWGEQRIRMKYSFSRSSYADLRPDLLGSNGITSALKDYNGQTYWLSVSPGSFLKESSFPKWLAFSVGYSGAGMLTGAPPLPGDKFYGATVRQRQWLLSLDVDLSKIPTQKAWLRSVFKVVNFVKIPAPAIMYGTQSGWRGYGLYF